jgi:site-specific recombinase XerD
MNLRPALLNSTVNEDADQHVGSVAAEAVAHVAELRFRPESLRWFTRLTEEGKASRTLDCYARDLRDVARAVECLNLGSACVATLASLRQAQIDEISAFFTAEGASNGTVLRRFAALRGFARFLSVDEGVDCRHVLWATLPPVVRGRSPSITPDDLVTFLSVPADGGWVHVRNAAIFKLQASTGLTTSEIISLDIPASGAKLSILSVLHTHLDARAVAPASDAIRTVDEYMTQAPFELKPGSPLFVNARGGRLSSRSVQLAFRALANSLAISVETGPMCLRQAFGKQLAAAGHPPAAVAILMGVSLPSVARYFSEP